MSDLQKNVILTADCYGFEQRVMIIVPNLDAIIHTSPTDYIKVTGWKTGDDNHSGEHQVQILSLRNFFVIDSPKTLTEIKP